MLKKIFFIGLVLLSACSVGLDYRRTALNLKPNFLNITSSKEEQKEWWQTINDPILNRWIQTLDDENYSLKAALERSMQAEENLNIQNASFWPSLSIESSSGRRKTVASSFGALGNKIGVSKFYNNSFSLQAVTSWQIDLFGKLRRAYQQQEAVFLATDFDRVYLRQSLIADLIKSRAGIANTNKQIKLANEIIASRKNVLNTVRQRYNSGVAMALDLRLAEDNYHTALAALPVLETNLQMALYSVDVLLGKIPGSTKSELEDLIILPAPEEIEIPQPLSLIDRRPDLISNELRLYAATQDIGVAVADLYPDLNFSAAYGFNSLDANNLIKPEKVVWSLATSLSQRLFEGGRLKANIRLKESRAKELEANYLSAILNALREVETALLKEKNFRKQYDHLANSVQNLRQAEIIATNRYQQGLSTIIELLDTQRRRASLEQQYLNAELNIWNSRVDLYLALGGIWEFNKKESENEKNV